MATTKPVKSIILEYTDGSTFESTPTNGALHRIDQTWDAGAGAPTEWRDRHSITWSTENYPVNKEA